jgi:hypothetical protein
MMTIVNSNEMTAVDGTKMTAVSRTTNDHSINNEYRNEPGSEKEKEQGKNETKKIESTVR